MASAHPFTGTETREFEGPEAVVAVACFKCRTAAFYAGGELGVRGITEHAVRCGARDVVIIEILPPVLF